MSVSSVSCFCFCPQPPLPAGAGLANPHALCFMNSVIQALAYTPGLVDDCLEGLHRRRCFARRAEHKASVWETVEKKRSEGLVSRDEGSDSASGGDFCAFCLLEVQIARIRRAGGASEGRRGFVRNCLAPYVRPFIWRAFRPGRQEDAHEFFRFLLDALMKAPSSKAAAALLDQQARERRSGKASREVRPELALTSYFGRLFGGWLRSRVVCAVCKKSSVRFESALDIPIDLGRADAGSFFKRERQERNAGSASQTAERPLSLECAIARFVRPETLCGDNAYM